MKTALLLAAVYNLIWGGFAILAPETMLRWLQFRPLPVYPELWQCIGMIVGVYGIGYAIAAFSPYRHWPIVLVGLLGKLFGPIGFAKAVWDGRLPASMGWTILTNDIIWWIPFAVVLWHAAKAGQAGARILEVPPPRHIISPLQRMFSQTGCTLAELSSQTPVLVVFLRHSGCTFCREALADIAAARSKIEEAGTTIALVHMGQTEPTELLEKHNLTDLHCFRDPSCALYETFGLELGGFRQLLGPKVWWRGFFAFFSGHGIGALNGNGFRMPGVFLLWNSRIVRAYRHGTAADRPDYLDLALLPSDAGQLTEARQHPELTPTSVPA